MEAGFEICHCAIRDDVGGVAAKEALLEAEFTK